MGVVLDRLQQAKVRPAPLRSRAALLQHAPHGGGDGAELVPRSTHDLASDDGGGGLAQEAGLHGLAEVGDAVAVDLQLDLHGRAAELRMGAGGRVGMVEADGVRISAASSKILWL